MKRKKMIRKRGKKYALRFHLICEETDKLLDIVTLSNYEKQLLFALGHYGLGLNMNSKKNYGVVFKYFLNWLVEQDVTI